MSSLAAEAGGWVPWVGAWHDALYAASGFYRSSAGPAGSFATSAQGLPGSAAVLAGALVSLMRREELTAFVDFACGRGELVSALHRLAPDAQCVGVDVVARPQRLAVDIGWIQSRGGAAVPSDLGIAPGNRTLVLANEWLDVVPCPIAEVDETGRLRTVLVRPTTGVERLDGPLTDADLSWCQRNWSLDRLEPGDRVEVGRPRDVAWLGLVDALATTGPGVVVAVDYGHTSATRPAAGTLTGYRDGLHVVPVPNGSCDLTAHVAMDSLGADEIVSQRDMLRALGIRGSLPDHAQARAEPAAYLRGLADSSAEAALLAPGGLGGFSWAVTRVPGTLPV